MKRVLFLGYGPAQQRMISAIKKQGYYVVVCHNVLKAVVFDADAVYYVENLDDDEVIAIAKSERVDGVVSNKDACMHTVASVSSALGLVGNTPQSINNLQNKFLLRQIQKEVGVFTPESYLVKNIDEILAKAKQIKYPVIVKPCISSGSRGVIKIDEYDEQKITTAFNNCMAFSNGVGVIIEGYVPRKLTNLECDVFVHHNTFLWVGYETNVCSPNKPMQPCGGMFPADETEENKAKFEEDVKKILTKAGIVHGIYNVEAIIMDEGTPFIIEINARMAGATVPEIIKKHCDIDVYELLVTTALGDDSYFEKIKNSKWPSRFITSFRILPHNDGVFTGLYIADDIKKYVYNTMLWDGFGIKVSRANKTDDSLGKVYLEYPDRKTQLDTLLQLSEKIKPIIE